MRVATLSLQKPTALKICSPQGGAGSTPAPGITFDGTCLNDGSGAMRTSLRTDLRRQQLQEVLKGQNLDVTHTLRPGSQEDDDLAAEARGSFG